MEVFRASADQYTPMGFRTDDDGKGWVAVTAHANLVANTPYRVIGGQYGFVSEAIASGTCYCMIGFPNQAESTSDTAWLQVQGFIAEPILTTAVDFTAGEWVALVAGAFTSNAADNVAGIFAVCSETASGAATPELMLIQHGFVNVTT